MSISPRPAVPEEFPEPPQPWPPQPTAAREPKRTNAPMSGSAGAPKRRRGWRLARRIVASLTGLALAAVVAIIVYARVSQPSDPFGAGWFVQEYTVSPASTQMLDDAGQTVLAELYHLGETSAQYKITGGRLYVGSPNGAPHPGRYDPLTALTGRGFSPVVSLRQLVDIGTNQMQQGTAGQCLSPYTDYACSSDRTFAGKLGPTYMWATDIAGVTVAPDQATGAWQVAVTVMAGRLSVPSDVVAQQGILAFIGKLDGEEQWSLTSWAGGPARIQLQPTGLVVPDLSQADAQRLAAVLRLAKAQVTIKAGQTLIS